MLQAFLRRKINAEVRCEDTLTSSVFGLLQYLPSDILWELLKDSCPYGGHLLPPVPGDLEEVYFWERYPDDARNKKYVEPDLVLQFEKADLIIEAKRFDDTLGGYAQDEAQWEKELLAYRRNIERDVPLLFIALGGNTTLQPVKVSVRNETHIIFKGLWRDLLESVVKHRPFVGKENKRLLDDVERAFMEHGYFCMEWLSGLSAVGIDDTSLTRIDRWGYQGYTRPCFARIKIDRSISESSIKIIRIWNEN